MKTRAELKPLSCAVLRRTEPAEVSSIEISDAEGLLVLCRVQCIERSDVLSCAEASKCSQNMQSVTNQK
ncbi:MAG: hypothetical protein R6V32_08980, partial [Bacteroidales bacterium]